MTNLFTKRNITIFIVLLVLLVIGYFVLPVSIPLITAYVTALLLLPAVKFLVRRTKINRTLSIMTVFSLFLLLLGVITYYLATTAITQATQFVENLPLYINELNRALIDFQNFLDDHETLPADFVQAINQEMTELLSDLGSDIRNLNLIGQITAFVSSIPGYLISFIVYVIALFLFMLDMPRLKTKMFSYLTERTQERVTFMTSRFSSVIFGFLKAQFLVSIPIFLVTLGGLLLITPEVAVLMSLIIWAIDFIPIIGSIAVLAPWAIFLFIAGDLATGSQLMALAIVLLIIRRTVEPKVMGTHIGLSPLATLISLYLGVMLLGAIGFIIGPLTVIAFTTAREAGMIKLNFRI